MKYLLIYAILLFPFFLFAQAEKDVVGRVTAANKSGVWHHVAFVSEYGYNQNSIQKNDHYFVRSGANNIRYNIDSVSYTSVLTGFNARLMLTALDGYAGTFPVSVAVIYRPQGYNKLGLIDPSAPTFVTWGIINRNFIKLSENDESIYGIYKDDVEAANNGVPLNGLYQVAWGSLSSPAGTLRRRIL